MWAIYLTGEHHSKPGVDWAWIFFLVELEVNGFVIHYTFPAFLDFLAGTKPGCDGEQEACCVRGMSKKTSARAPCCWALL